MIITSIRIRVLSRFILLFLRFYDCEMSMFFFRASVDFPSITNCFSVGTRKLVEFIGLEIPAKNDSSRNSDSEQRQQ